MKNTRFWIVIIALVAAASAGALVWQHIAAKRVAERQTPVIAEIYVEGECVRTIDLAAVTEPEEFEVSGAIGTNTIRVEPGRVCVTQAECPDHVCIQMGWLSVEHPSPIVCLPNKVVIQLQSGSENDPQIDGVT
ncbi:MAG: NusG domain II-containing protein [Oscillospiraceae bacterium]|nr:NusG domain II-containing protein [Oscillospiraceae bacterium]